MTFRGNIHYAILLSALALGACGGGGGGGGTPVEPCVNAPSAPSPVLPKLTSPVTAQVSVTVTDPGFVGGTVSYQWKSSDGSIANLNAPTTTWTLPNGPGLHFAYVLVSNGHGGYTERRIAVNTDDFGFAAVVPAPTDYVAPAGGVQTGNYYSGYVAGSSVSQISSDRSSFRTFKPDALVYVTNTAGDAFPTGGATAPVTTNIRGQFVIPGLPSVAADAQLSDKYIVNCSGDAGVTWGNCNALSEMPGMALNESGASYVSGSKITGRFRLADKSACGTVNEFFGVEVTATATLLNRAKVSLRGPIRLSHEGDFTFLNQADAAFVSVTCETHAPIIIPIGENASLSSKFLGTVTLSGVKAPTVSEMTASVSNVAVGLFLPPPSGLPSDLASGREKFLAFRGMDTRQGACQYYKAIGAVKTCDTSGNFTGAISFNDWKRTVRMAPYAAAGTTEYVATYINQVDLNLTRNHHSISYGQGDTAAYVCNHLGPKDNSQPEINTAIDNAVNGKNLVACVAMDHHISPGVNGDQPFTRFLIFGPDGSLLPSIDLDGRSEKFVPGTCVVCHGGDKYAGKFPEQSGDGFADIGAHFLPYDIGNFAFSCKPGLTRADQEEALYHLNQNVLNTGPTPAAQELIAGWYAAGSHTLNADYVPLSWQEANLPIERQGTGLPKAYQTLISHSCRTCHVNLPEKYNFDHFPNATIFTNSTVCGNTSNQWRGYSMPNSLVTFNRFWQSPEQLAAYKLIKQNTCNLNKQGDLGRGDLVAGDAHTVNTMADGTLWARGDNSAGQLGGGSTVSYSSKPVQVGNDSNWLRVAAGAKHTLAIKNDGTLWAWGDNTYGQLGDNSKISRLTPVQVVGAGTDNLWSQIAAGERHTIALKSNGELWAWGNNQYGQLGIGGAAESQVPMRIGMDTWTTIAAGRFHTLAIMSTPTNGTLWSWGRNDKGQLGDGGFNDRNTPGQVGVGTGWDKIAAGTSHSLAIDLSLNNQLAYIYTLWAWGDNSFGQLGDGTLNLYTQPTQISTNISWDAVVTYGDHTVGGSGLGLFGWGNNAFGQLGDTTTTNRSSPTPINSGQVWNWYGPGTRPAIGVGASHTSAWDDFGYLWSWGSNALGQLGDGTTIQHLEPTLSLMAPIVIATPPETTITAGTYFQYNFSVLNVNAQPLTFSKVSGPAWLTLNGNAGIADTAILSGTPSNADIGPNNVVLSVSDGILTTQYTVTVIVQ